MLKVKTEMQSNIKHQNDVNVVLVFNDDDWPGREGFSVQMSQTHITENLYMTG